MQYILLLQYNNGDQDYYDFTNKKDAEEKMVI